MILNNDNKNKSSNPSKRFWIMNNDMILNNDIQGMKA